MAPTLHQQINWHLQSLARLIKEVPINPVTVTRDSDDVIAAVCEVWGIPRQELLSRRKFVHLTDPRWAACWLMHQLGMPSTLIGRALKRDHGTVLYALRKVADLIETEPKYRTKLERAQALLQQKVVDFPCNITTHNEVNTAMNTA